ncbi:MAG: hypothetical protein AABM67_01890 [Acidobacteriota bacterium]
MKSSSSSLLIVSALWLLLVLGCASSTNQRSGSTSGNRESASRGTPIPVSAADLVAAYKANEVAADENYKDKLLAVSGTVDSIGKDILDSMYVTLSSGEEYSITSVQCMFDDASKSQLARLSKGQRVTIVGVCNGKFGNVLLKDSELR